jgi:lactate dehydrogenase-like 2-hydroxyacid dehydrogenase
MFKVFITRKIPDLATAILKANGCEVDVNPNDRPMSREELLSTLRSKPYDAVLTLLNDKIDEEIILNAPTVKIFANYTIGFDNFDIEAGKRHGVYMTNAPGGGADRVAEHAFALLLALTCRVVEGDDFVKSGKYIGWDPMLLPGIKLLGKTMGIIGAGRIGTEVARIASKGFGMRIAYTDIVRNQKIESLHNASWYPTREEVLKQSDIVSLHVPLTNETKHFINKDHLQMMKRCAYLINTSRGPVVDEVALVEALKNGIIAGAGLDVFENEPNLAPGLADLQNAVLTPHIASASLDCRDDMARIAAQNIVAVLKGDKPLNLVYN